MSQQNPFSYGYDLTLAALKAWTPLTAVVAVGNIIDVDDPAYRPKPNPQAADRPELLLQERQITAQTLSRDSQGAFFECVYPLQIKSGKLGVDQVNLVTILVLQALTSAGPFVGDKPIPLNVIDKWEWVNANLSAKDQIAGRPQWVLMGGVKVSFSMRRSDFLAASFT